MKGVVLMNIYSVKEIDKNLLTQFFITHWGSPQMIISSGIFQCDELDGFAVLNEEGDIIGLVTYVVKGDECEIISIDSLVENKGIGSSLLKKVEQSAKEQLCSHIKVITTNDNLHAMGFYQKRGYRISEVLINAVDKAREIKPEIPLVADNGIPICDEIVFVKS
jgi:N-acetylglutamate synthase-like GNAT family acetyltransferase